MKLIYMIFFCFCIEAMADQINSLRFRQSSSSDSFQVDSGLDLQYGVGAKYKTFFSLSYEQADKLMTVVETGGDEKVFDIVAQLKRLRLSGGYFFSPTWYFGITVPMDEVTAKQPYDINGDNAQLETSSFSTSDHLLGDINLKLKKRLSHSSDLWNLTLGADIVLPTGDANWYNTDDSVSGGLSISFSRFLDSSKRWRSYGNLGFFYAPNAKIVLSDQFAALDSRQRILTGLGLSFDLNKTFNFFTEFSSQISMPFKNYQNPFNFNIGVNLKFRNMIAFGGYGLESLLDSEHSQNRFFGGLKFQLGRRTKKEIKDHIDFKAPKVPTYTNVKRFLEKQSQPVTSTIASPIKLLEVSRSIGFQTSLAEVMPIYHEELDEFISFLHKFKNQIEKIKIVGHSDSRGELTWNEELSLKRALALKDYFVNRGGLHSSMFIVEGQGSKNLLVKEADTLSRNINRRVEFYVYKIREQQ